MMMLSKYYLHVCAIKTDALPSSHKPFYTKPVAAVVVGAFHKPSPAGAYVVDTPRRDGASRRGAYTTASVAPRRVAAAVGDPTRAGGRRLAVTLTRNTAQIDPRQFSARLFFFFVSSSKILFDTVGRFCVILP